MIKVWCRTQAIIALSSVEAELYGLVRASAETLGPMSLVRDLWMSLSGHIMGDASAALAIVQREGLGKLRHVDAHYLWIQEKAARKELEYGKVKRTEDGADPFTKTLGGDQAAPPPDRRRDAGDNRIN